MTSCVNRAEAVFPEAKGLSDQDWPGEMDGLGEAKPNGDFVYSVRDKDGSLYFSCRGNVSDGRIDEVTYKTKTARPSETEYWGFE